MEIPSVILTKEEIVTLLDREGYELDELFFDPDPILEKLGLGDADLTATTNHITLKGRQENNSVTDVSVKDDTLEGLPPVERTRSKPKRQSAVAANGRMKITSNAPKAQGVAKTAAGHPYLRRGEVRRG